MGDSDDVGLFPRPSRTLLDDSFPSHCSQGVLCHTFLSGACTLELIHAPQLIQDDAFSPSLAMQLLDLVKSRILPTSQDLLSEHFSKLAGEANSSFLGTPDVLI